MNKILKISMQELIEDTLQNKVHESNSTVLLNSNKNDNGKPLAIAEI